MCSAPCSALRTALVARLCSGPVCRPEKACADEIWYRLRMPLRRRASAREKTPRRPKCPPGYYTSPMLRQRLGLSEKQFRQLVTSQTIGSDMRDTTTNTALYSEATLQMLLNRQIDGSLFARSESPATEGVLRSPETPSALKGWTPDDSALVFELLNAGTPLHHIVMKTKLDPFAVRRIQQIYDEMAGSITVPKSILDQMNRCMLPGTFPLRSATDILQILKNCETERICPDCSDARSADRCASCIMKNLGSGTQPAQSNGPAKGSNPAAAAASISASQASASSQNVRQ